MSVFGTRPEAIKMCPLIKELEQHEGIESIVCLTGQHKEMLQQVIDIFGTKVQYNLDIMQPRQTLTTITASVLERLGPVLEKEQPDIVLVHGDTSTSFAAALAAFYRQIPVGHVEAGLRTFDRYSPFPEEMNRSLTGRIAELHFAPTETNKKNLENENIRKGIYVTGNTVIDAFRTTVKPDYKYKNEDLKAIDFTGKRCVLMTAHRRENLGKPLENICRAVKRISEEYPDLELIYPVHMNPAVRDTASAILGSLSRVHLMFEEAARLVVNSQQGSTSSIQRRFSIGYNRAGRIMDQLEAAGIVGPFEGSKARQVLIQDEYSLEQILNK